MTAPEDHVRPMSAILLLGLLMAPILFCWFVLRRGYASSFRWAVFVYTIIMTVVPAIGRFAG